MTGRLRLRLLPLLLLLVLAGVGALATGCRATKYYEREKLNDRAMTFDADDGLVYLRDKIEAAREGSFGGYGAASAGGCGCQ